MALVAADIKKVHLSVRDDAGKKQLSDSGVSADIISVSRLFVSTCIASALEPWSREEAANLSLRPVNLGSARFVS